MPTGHYPRKPMSAATKAKIGAANRGRVPSPEARAKMSAALVGKKRGPYSAAHCAAISAAKKGVPTSPEHRAALADALRGRKPGDHVFAASRAATKGRKRAPFSAEWRARIGAAQVGRTQTPESNQKRADSVRRAWAEGRKSPNTSYRYTSLARALHVYLESTGLSLEPEVRFGRFTVDLYDRENHVAYEADGRYWHERNEARYPGYHARRDAYLIERFGLKVVHYTDDVIRDMAKRRVA